MAKKTVIQKAIKKYERHKSGVMNQKWKDNFQERIDELESMLKAEKKQIIEAFKAGCENGSLHPDDDSYDQINAEEYYERLTS